MIAAIQEAFDCPVNIMRWVALQLNQYFTSPTACAYN